MNDPKIISDKVIIRSPWIRIIERHVDFGGASAEQIYHCVDQSDYVTIIPVDKSGHTVLVRQFRPAVAAYTWEFPAGTLEKDESPTASAGRELIEEIGLSPCIVHHLGSFAADTGRHSNRIHNFLAEIDSPQPTLKPEANMQARWISFAEVFAMIRDGSFPSQLQIATLTLAYMHPKTRNLISWGDSA